MMFLNLFLGIALAATPQVKVVVIDSGLNLKDERFIGHLCDTGHIDLTNEGIEDKKGHGTFVAGLIMQNAENANYCMVIIKYFEKGASHVTNQEKFSLALQLASNVPGVRFVNFSGGGGGKNIYEEKIIIEHPEITYVVAAGNEGANLDTERDDYCPACYRYPNVIPVGSINAYGKISEFSNYGKRVVYEMGENSKSTLPDGYMGYMSGTSMSCGIHTGKLVKERYENH